MLSNNWTPAGADEESNNPAVARRGGRGGGLDAPLAELPTKKKRAAKSVEQKEEEVPTQNVYWWFDGDATGSRR